MSNLLHRIRGLAGVGITWGALWGVIGAGIGLVLGLVSPGAWDWTNPILGWAFGMGLYGAVSGVGFATLLSLGERRKTILDLSLRRVAIWGVLGSAAVPLLLNAMGLFGLGEAPLADILGAVAFTGLLGGTFAPASVAIARRAELSAGEEHPLLESES